MSRTVVTPPRRRRCSSPSNAMIHPARMAVRRAVAMARVVYPPLAMRVGVVLDGRRSATEIAELARLAESCGLAHVWLGAGARTKDHFVRLAVAAAATRRIQLGAVAVSP